MIKRFLCILMLGLMPALLFNNTLAKQAPEELVKQTADDVLNIVRTDPEIQAGNTEKLYALAEEKILPYFNFDRVCRLVLGKHWRRADDAQKTSFQQEFRALLLRTYSSALVKYKIDKIDFKNPKYSKDKRLAKVPAVITPVEGPDIGVTYTLQDDEDSWRVIDIVIENISLVTNYRSQFATEIRQNGLNGLIEKLAAKNKKATGQ